MAQSLITNRRHPFKACARTNARLGGPSDERFAPVNRPCRTWSVAFGRDSCKPYMGWHTVEIEPQSQRANLCQSNSLHLGLGIITSGCPMERLRQ